jgi:hypothetical protein
MFYAELPVDDLFSYYYSRLSLIILILSDEVVFSLDIKVESEEVCFLTINLVSQGNKHLHEKCLNILQWLSQETAGKIRRVIPE